MRIESYHLSFTGHFGKVQSVEMPVGAIAGVGWEGQGQVRIDVLVPDSPEKVIRHFFVATPNDAGEEGGFGHDGENVQIVGRYYRPSIKTGSKGLVLEQGKPTYVFELLS